MYSYFSEMVTNSYVSKIFIHFLIDSVDHSCCWKNKQENQTVVSAQDVSADLRELGRTPVAVVAAGVKSILDIARTLEYLVGPIAKYLDFAQH